MREKTLLNFIFVFVLLLAACTPLTPGVDGSATQTATVPTPTAFLPDEPTPAEPASPTPTQPAASPSGQQFLAYVSGGQLLVTDVTNGIQGGTTQYTLAGESDQVTDLVWSPSGEFVAFVSAATGEPHIFAIFALGQSSPIDLGPGSAPAWSPDSQSIAYIGGTFPDDNIWVTAIDNPAPRQLTFETNYAWGRPTFTPDGSSLMVAGADRDYMGVSGNTSFTLESLALDGSGTRLPLPGAAPFEGARLPYDLRFSPDGSQLAFSTSFHLSACASPGAYYVSNADGSNLQNIVSPSMQAVIDPNDPNQEYYHVGLSYAWLPTSDALVALGNVVDCAPDSPTLGQVVAGPQMSILGLPEGTGEWTIIPGFFYGISTDRRGTMIAAARFENGFQDADPTVEIYSTQAGQLLLSLGSGSNPQFQP